jgi:hypothetical protein
MSPQDRLHILNEIDGVVVQRGLRRIRVLWRREAAQAQHGHGGKGQSHGDSQT